MDYAIIIHVLQYKSAKSKKEEGKNKRGKNSCI
jgi:hypothetical protein